MQTSAKKISPFQRFATNRLTDLSVIIHANFENKKEDE